MASHIVGYTRMGPKREPKFALELFWDGKSIAEELQKVSEKVLYDICHNHADSSFCLKALKSDPSASLPDLVGLANISINLADVAANKTLELIASLKSKTSDTVLASQYESCGVFYGNIVDIIEDAKKAWKAGDYETVFVKAGGILTYNVDCSDALTFAEASSLQEANKEVYNCFTTLLRVSKRLRVLVLGNANVKSKKNLAF